MDIMVKGRVAKGLGKGSYFTSLSWFCDQAIEKLGFRPFPGTLNLELTREEAVKVQNYSGEKIAVDPIDPQFCGAVCYPVLIKGIIWGALIKPMASIHPPEVVEIIAPVSLKDSLGVIDGEQVTFCWDQGPRPWPLKKEEKLADYRIFQVFGRQAVSPRLKQDFMFYAIQSRDWVQIIPITSNEEVLMVRQFRHGTREITLELPGGLVDKGMTPIEAAQRELAEEVGHIGHKIKLLGRVRPNPAILTNWCYFFLAEDLVSEQKPQDEGEDVFLLPVPLKKIPGLIKAGAISHSLVITAFYHLGFR